MVATLSMAQPGLRLLLPTCNISLKQLPWTPRSSGPLDNSLLPSLEDVSGDFPWSYASSFLPPSSRLTMDSIVGSH